MGGERRWVGRRDGWVGRGDVGDDPNARQEVTARCVMPVAQLLGRGGFCLSSVCKIEEKAFALSYVVSGYALWR